MSVWNLQVDGHTDIETHSEVFLGMMMFMSTSRHMDVETYS